MSLIADRQGSLTSPEWFEPGAEYKASRDERGRIVLEKLAKRQPQSVVVSLVQQGKFTRFATEVPVPDEAIADAVRRHREDQAR